MKRDVYVILASLAVGLGIGSQIEGAGVGVANAVTRTVSDSFDGRAPGAIKTSMDTAVADPVLEHYAGRPTGHTLTRLDLGTKFEKLEVTMTWYIDGGVEVLDWRYHVTDMNVETTLNP